MLDQHFAGRDFLPWFLIRGQRRGHLGPIYAYIDVSGTSNFELFETGHRADPGDNLFGNLAGRLAELAGEFKGNRQRIFSELNFGRLLYDELGQVETVCTLQKSAQSFV